jgi:hypothetical protein
MMTQDKTYNGWKNYETWNVVLWLFNDERLHNELYTGLDTYFRCGMSMDDLKYVVRKTFFNSEDGTSATPDGVWLDDKRIDWKEVKKAVMDGRPTK